MIFTLDGFLCHASSDAPSISYNIFQMPNNVITDASTIKECLVQVSLLYSFHDNAISLLHTGPPQLSQMRRQWLPLIHSITTDPSFKRNIQNIIMDEIVLFGAEDLLSSPLVKSMGSVEDDSGNSFAQAMWVLQQQTKEVGDYLLNVEDHGMIQE